MSRNSGSFYFCPRISEAVLCRTVTKAPVTGRMLMMADGVTGNTSDFGSEESRFEPWSANKEGNPAKAGFFVFRISRSRVQWVISTPWSASGSCFSKPHSTAYNSGNSALKSTERSKKYSMATAKNSSWLVAA